MATRALSLSRGLAKAQSAFRAGERSAPKLIAAAAAEIAEDPNGAIPVRVDYIALVDPDTMRPVDPAPSRTLMALAVRVGKTRLIDNRLL